MIPIEAPLKRHDRGVAVVNLQNALLFLLEKECLRLSEDERRALLIDREAQVYGDGTSRAVMAFREQFQLEPGDIVDEPTALRLITCPKHRLPGPRAIS